jgi:VanZ family protein
MTNKIVFILYGVFIAFVSLVPSEITPDINLWDKGSHFIAYLVFAFLASRVTKNKKALAYVSVGIVIYSGLLEIVQSVVPGRMMSGRDLLANALGVAAGFLLFQVFKIVSLKRPNPDGIKKNGLL